ncbi:MAG: SUMF1/EgtB/PvdO family nonheme iron enzyme [Candidatus Cloacimonadota bacterium]
MPAPEDSSKPNPKKPPKLLRKVGHPKVEATSCRLSSANPSTEKGSEAQPIVEATSCRFSPAEPSTEKGSEAHPKVEATSCRFSPTEPSTENEAYGQPIVEATSCRLSSANPSTEAKGSQNPDQRPKQSAPKHPETPRKPKKYLLPVAIVIILFVLAFGGYLLYQKISSDRQIQRFAEQGFILVEGGEFAPGSGARASRKLVLGNRINVYSFFLQKTELTQAEWSATMPYNPSKQLGADLPVEHVSWFQAIEYCNRRSLKEGLTPCYSYADFGTNPDSWPEGWDQEDENHTNLSCNWLVEGYRLPSEMEWLFAAGGGMQSRSYTYSGSNEVDAVAWHKGNSGGSIHAVATKAPNELGLYDMSGNVWEWAWDIYGIFRGGIPLTPYGATSGDMRCGRGGSWNYEAGFCALDKRSNGFPTITSGDLGFRICRSMP